jgi:hypothetical protein
MRSKYHRIWIANDEKGRLLVGFSESDDKIKHTERRYYQPTFTSGRRLSYLLNLSLNTETIVYLHPTTGPSILFYVPRTRKPAPALWPALALAA